MFAVFLVLICSLVDTSHFQTAPYVSFMGVNLPNNSYLNLTTVGNDTSDFGDTVICHTDLESCCLLLSPTGGNNGEWYFPNVTALLGSRMGDNIYRLRAVQLVHIRRRNNAMSPSGIYQCDIETYAVYDNNVFTINGETVYVGLYLPNEGKLFFFISVKQTNVAKLCIQV